jgi:hypothetical protein
MLNFIQFVSSYLLASVMTNKVSLDLPLTHWMDATTYGWIAGVHLVSLFIVSLLIRILNNATS